MDNPMSSSMSELWKRILKEDAASPAVDEVLQQYQEEQALQLNLNSHTISKTSNLDVPAQEHSLDLAGLDEDLARRYANLKAPPQTKHSSFSGPDKTKEDEAVEVRKEKEGTAVHISVNDEEVQILGSDLAMRFAALKATSMKETQSQSQSQSQPQPQFNVGEADFRNQEVELPESEKGFLGQGFSGEEQIKNLLDAAKDAVKFQKARVSRVSAEDEDDDEKEERISESEVDEIVAWAKDAARLDPSDAENVTENEDEWDASDTDSDMEGSKKKNSRHNSAPKKGKI